MRLRKSISGTVILILYSALFLIMMAFMFYHEIQGFQSGGFFELQSIITFASSIVLLLICILYRVFKLKKMQMDKKPFHLTLKQSRILEILLLGSLVCLVFVIAVKNIWEIDITKLDQFYLHSATIRDTQSIIFYDNSNPVYFYHQLLTALCTFFGNKIYPALFLQAVLYCFTILVLYAAVRQIAGATAAFLTISGMGLLSVLQKNTTQLNPDILWFLVISIGIYSMFSILTDKSYKKAILTGMVLSLVCFFDVVGLLFVILAFLFMIVSHFRLQQDRVVNEKRTFLMGRITLFTFAFLSGVIILFFFKYYLSDRLLIQQMNELYHLYFDRINLDFTSYLQNIAISYFEIPLVFRVFMILPAAVWIFSYWTARYDVAYPVVAFFIGIHLFSGIFTEQLQYMMLLFFAWLCIGAVGMNHIAFSTLEIPDSEKSIKTNAIPEILEAAENAKVEDQVKEKLVIISESAKKPELLDNPLPVPPRHVKKVMDYAFIPMDHQMHYDLDSVNSNDDYDI